jgi:hypothetical protein
MGFTARGSFGTDYEKRADGQISGSENKDGRSLEEKLKGIGAGEVAVIGQPYVDTSVPVKEYFVQFTEDEIENIYSKFMQDLNNQNLKCQNTGFCKMFQLPVLITK